MRLTLKVTYWELTGKDVVLSLEGDIDPKTEFTLNFRGRESDLDWTPNYFSIVRYNDESKTHFNSNLNRSVSASGDLFAEVPDKYVPLFRSMNDWVNANITQYLVYGKMKGTNTAAYEVDVPVKTDVAVPKYVRIAFSGKTYKLLKGEDEAFRSILDGLTSFCSESGLSIESDTTMSAPGKEAWNVMGFRPAGDRGLSLTFNTLYGRRLGGIDFDFVRREKYGLTYYSLNAHIKRNERFGAAEDPDIKSLIYDFVDETEGMDDLTERLAAFVGLVGRMRALQTAKGIAN